MLFLRMVHVTGCNTMLLLAGTRYRSPFASSDHNCNIMAFVCMGNAFYISERNGAVSGLVPSAMNCSKLVTMVTYILNFYACSPTSNILIY